MAVTTHLTGKFRYGAATLANVTAMSVSVTGGAQDVTPVGTKWALNEATGCSWTASVTAHNTLTDTALAAIRTEWTSAAGDRASTVRLFESTRQNYRGDIILTGLEYGKTQGGVDTVTISMAGDGPLVYSTSS